MNRKVIIISSMLGFILGPAIPIAAGVDNGLGPWSVLSGFVCGMLGILVGVVLSKWLR